MSQKKKPRNADHVRRKNSPTPKVPSVCELSRMLGREECLWAPQLKVSQPALS